MISIIIVNYHVKNELISCINSIIKSNPKTPYEIIVVDNDEHKTIYKDLIKRFPLILYIPNKNKGFGEGNNTGVKHSKGEFLFFLNPDTLIFKHSIDNLAGFLQKHKEVGIAAPLLLGSNKKPYQQGARKLTPQVAFFVLSFLNKIFPNNPISKNYFMKEWDRNSLKEVDVAPGTAFVMRKELFNKIGGFDEEFFLFFEEFDLCNRVKDLGFKIFINPDAQVLHYWGLSTKKLADSNKIFRKSRFYYFRKHFGLLPALFIELFLLVNKKTIFLGIILISALIIIFYSKLQKSIISK